MSKQSDWVVIAIEQGEFAANVIKSLLESEDIPVLLQYGSGGRVYPFVVGGMAEVKVLVPRGLEEKARELIKPEEQR